MNKLIVLNHKMSLMYDEVYNYIERLNNIITDHDVIICPSNIYLEAFLNNSDYAICCQNVNSSTNENNTGEISTSQVKRLGVEYSLVGHYERIINNHENSKIINDKLIACLDSNIFPILCFGEELDEDYKNVLPKMLDSYLKDIENISFITFAYEPVYAIGTGVALTKNKIEEVVNYIANYLEDKYHTKPTIIYGGSVDSSNISDIINIDSLSGVMVGSISSNITEVEKMLKKI